LFVPAGELDPVVQVLADPIFADPAEPVVDVPVADVPVVAVPAVAVTFVCPSCGRYVSIPRVGDGAGCVCADAGVRAGAVAGDGCCCLYTVAAAGALL
jgi:hypothetical protein